MQKRFIKALYVLSVFFILAAIWEFVTILNIIPRFMLPTPLEVLQAFISGFPALIEHSFITFYETFCGIIISVVLAFAASILMDKYFTLKSILYPILIVTQTVPTIVIAPIMVLLFGYGVLPKIILVVLCCFFPIAVSLVEGFTSVDEEYLNLLKSMGASYNQTLIHLKVPFSVPYFFSGIKVSVAYAFTSAVAAEWLGGTYGLGVYMTRVKSAYAFDKLFASVLFISIVSYLFMKGINLAQNKILKHLHMSKRG